MAMDDIIMKWNRTVFYCIEMYCCWERCHETVVRLLMTPSKDLVSKISWDMRFVFMIFWTMAFTLNLRQKCSLKIGFFKYKYNASFLQESLFSFILIWQTMEDKTRVSLEQDETSDKQPYCNVPWWMKVAVPNGCLRQHYIHTWKYLLGLR